MKFVIKLDKLVNNVILANDFNRVHLKEFNAYGSLSVLMSINNTQNFLQMMGERRHLSRFACLPKKLVILVRMMHLNSRLIVYSIGH